MPDPIVAAIAEAAAITRDRARGRGRVSPAVRAAARAAPPAPAPASRLWQYLGQIPAGAVQSTVGNTASREERVAQQRMLDAIPDRARSYIDQQRAITAGPIGIVRHLTGRDPTPAYNPALRYAPGAMVGLVRTLAAPFTGLDPSDPNFQDSYFGGASMERINRSNEDVNRVLGVEHPENLLQLGLNVAGSMVLPGGRRIPITATTTSGRNLQRAASLGYEVLTPLRQMGFAPATAVGTTLAGGISETLDAVDNDIMPGYTSIADIIAPDRGTAPDDEDEELTIADVVADGADGDLSMNDVVGNDPDASLSMQDVITAQDLTSRTEEDDLEDEESFLTWRNAGIAAAGLLGARFTIRALRNNRRAAEARLAEEASEGLTLRKPTDGGGGGTTGGASAAAGAAGEVRLRGTRYNRSSIGAADRAITGAAQQDRPIRRMAEQFLGRDYADRMGWELTNIVNVSIGARVHNFLRTGRAPGVNDRRYTRLGPLLESYGRELDPNEQQLVDDAILASRAIDDVEFKRTQTAFNEYSEADLRSLVSRVQNDTKLGKYLDAARSIGRDQLDFMVRRGLLDARTADEWRRMRPNWAPFNRSEQFDADISKLLGSEYTANRSATSLHSTDVEGASVQAGGVAGPFQGYLDRWTNLIRFAEENRVRAKFLRDVEGRTVDTQGRPLLTADGKPMVRRIDDQTTSYQEQKVHTVLEDGRRVRYIVDDPAVNKALHLMPRATVQAFETTRQLMQNFVTGPLGTIFNGFAATKSVAYDTVLGMLLKPRDMELGNLNEILLRFSDGRFSIGRLDPTIMLGGPIGAIRYAWGEMLGNISMALEHRLLQEDSLLRSLLGDQATGTLARIIGDAYENSIKAHMDELGISSHTMHGTPDPAKPLTNISDIAPAFSRATAQQIYDSVRNDPNSKFFERLLASSNNWYARRRAGGIARTYQGIIEAMHNGFRAQALATSRRQRGYHGQMQQRASQLRRISADAAQHGGSDWLNKTAGSFMYANLAIQSAYEVSRKIVRDPFTFLTNYTMLALPIMALHYTAMALDPEARQYHEEKTPQQRASSVTTFGGAEIPLDPWIRTFVHPLMSVMDHVIGLYGEEPNLPVLDALESIIEDDDLNHELWTGLTANLRALLPFDTGNSIFFAPVAAAVGADVQSARFGEGAQEVRTQRLSASDEESAELDALASANTLNWIRAITGAFGVGIYDIFNDMQRSYLHESGGTIEDAVQRGVERYTDNLYRGAGPYRPLFGDHETALATRDGNWQQYNTKRDGIDRAMTVFQRDIRAPGLTSRGMPIPLEGDPLPEFLGTQAGYIGTITRLLARETNHVRQQMTQLGMQAEAIRNQHNVSRQEINQQLNELTRQRRLMALYLLQRTRHYEDVISRTLGEDFDYEDFDADRYRVPMPNPLLDPQ